VNLLIEYKADVNSPVDSELYGGKEYPLGLAVRRGDLDVVKRLVESGADLKAMNIWKAKLEIISGTALHIAYRCKQGAIAKWLIESCAELENIPNIKGELPGKK